jgi:transposase InsO family protein
LLGGAEFLKDKKAETVVWDLRQVLDRMTNRSFCIWSGNGSEFTGSEFETFMVSRAIRHVYSKPYNPQQNGKIERFWVFVEKAKDARLVDQCLGHYNQWPHTALAYDPGLLNRKVFMSPLKACQTMEHWKEQGPRTWRVNGETKNFDPPRAPLMDLLNWHPTPDLFHCTNGQSKLLLQKAIGGCTFGIEEVCQT